MSKDLMALNPKVSVEFKLSDLNRINELIERDTAMAVIEKTYSTSYGNYYLCPKCELMLVSEANFCHRCGQRVDMELLGFNV